MEIAIINSKKKRKKQLKAIYDNISQENNLSSVEVEPECPHKELGPHNNTKVTLFTQEMFRRKLFGGNTKFCSVK